MDSSTLSNMYKTAAHSLPSCTRPKLSNAKVENVVNPPQIPTFKNRIIFASAFEYLPARATVIPIISEPTMLIINVL